MSDEGASGAGTRLRRLRNSDGIRRMLREARLHPAELVAPIFVLDRKGEVEPVEEMPGVNRYSVDRLGSYVGRLGRLGVGSVLLFGVPSDKDVLGTGAYSKGGVVPRAVRSLRNELPELVILTDVCVCDYTTLGHCGVLSG